MRMSSAILALTLSASVATAASALTVLAIPGLYNTGVNGSGVTLGNNQVDPHWTLTAAPVGVTLGNAFTGVANGSFPLSGAWTNNDSVSRWITPTVSHSNTAPGGYSYRLQFTLTPDLIASTGAFTGRFLVDNAMGSILLNGTPIAAGAGGFQSWTSFASNGGFVSGLNTLTFNTVNAPGTSGNPTGLRVEFLSSSVALVPEPASWTMLISGFGLVGATMRRRRAVGALRVAG